MANGNPMAFLVQIRGLPNLAFKLACNSFALKQKKYTFYCKLIVILFTLLIVYTIVHTVYTIVRLFFLMKKWLVH